MPAPSHAVRHARALAAALLLAPAVAAAQGGVTAIPRSPATTPTVAAPPIQREFRAVWVASVSNIDWPSRPGLSTQEQQQELVALLDKAAQLRLNAIIFQVRPMGDALYRSDLEPWSEFLTGVQGQAPEPAWDPLEFAIEEAHARGMELHAWFNPYRAQMAGAKSPLAASHIAKRRPQLVKTYGRMLWMDPGEPTVRQHTLSVVMDVVKRYDVDGIHIDDYFYPYKVRAPQGGELEFPDDASWRKYRAGGGKLARDDWRRDNVDKLVEALYKETKKLKPWVKFGISPFGIWRPGYPESVRGLDAYTALYADSRKWMHEGWGDYFSPQLYWAIDRPQQSYEQLQRWWGEQNRKGRHLWIGNYTSRVGGAGGGDNTVWRAGELIDQIRLTRADSGASGNIHFSARALMRNQEGIADWLETVTYVVPALVPASPWLDRTPPALPGGALRPDASHGGVTLTLTPGGAGTSPFLWVVRARYGDEWRTEVLPGAARRHRLVPLGIRGTPDDVIVNAVDRVGNQSPDRVIR